MRLDRQLGADILRIVVMFARMVVEGSRAELEEKRTSESWTESSGTRKGVLSGSVRWKIGHE
jgi:hypothetical protein